LGCVAAQVAVTAWYSLVMENPPDVSKVLLTLLPFTVMPLASILPWASLLAMIMQGDAAYDGRAFWMTRPISAFQLVWEKTFLAIVLVLLLPVALHTLFLAKHGLTFLTLVDFAVCSAAIIALFVPVVMFLAAIARTFLRFWMFLFGGILVLSLAISITVYALHRSGFVVSGAASGSRIPVIGMTSAFGSLGLVFYLYASRSLLRALLAAAAMMGFLISVPFWWQWKLPFISNPPDPTLVSAPKELTIAVRNARCDISDSSARDDRRQELLASVSINGGTWPKTWRIGSLEGRALWQDGSDANVVVLLEGTNNQVLAHAITSALGGGIQWLNVGKLQSEFQENIQDSFTSKSQQPPASFVGVACGETVDYRLWAELRPDPDTRMTWLGDSARLTVKRLAVEQGSIVVSVSTQIPSHFFTDETVSDKALREPVLILVNRKRKEAVLLQPYESLRRPFFGLRIVDAQFKAELPDGVDVSWLKDATLCLISATVRERFAVPVEFAVSAKQGGETPKAISP
jgi:hypothetical protein